MTELLHSILDTRGLPPGRALAAWREAIGVFFDTRLRAGGEEAFHARVDAYLVGELVVGTSRTAAQDFDRPRSKIARDGRDQYLLTFYTEGSCGRRNGGSGERTRPGDLFISDVAQPLASAVTDCDSINLVVPRRLLAPLLKRPDEQNMRVVPGDTPLAMLFRNHLQALHRQAGALSLVEAQAIVGPTLELAAAAVNAAVAEEAARSVGVALFAEICRFVEAEIASPALSAGAVAARFGISERKLYYLFEKAGGFASYVQEERLRRCHAALVDPAQRHRPVAEIAESYGFAHPASFSRAFRRVFGLTAREARFLAAEGGGTPPAARFRGSDWSRWIAELR